MDSLTHAALGACLGNVILGKSLGRKAMLWGALSQNLPDIDGMGNAWLPVSEGLLAHRGLTHSLPVGVGAAALLALTLHHWQRNVGASTWQWFVFFMLQFSIHDLLDTANAYGTGLLEPFSHERFSMHLLYVIDPLFTLPLLVSVLVLITYSRQYASAQAWAVVGLGWVAFYVGAASFSKVIASRGVRQSLAAARIPATELLITPAPFNSLLWYAVAHSGPGYHVGYRSALEKAEQRTAFTYFPQQQSRLAGVLPSAEVDRMLRFANGYYTVERNRQGLAIDVLRFGQVGGWQHPQAPFVFRYRLSDEAANRLVVQRGRFEGWSQPVVTAYLQRILNVSH